MPYNPQAQNQVPQILMQAGQSFGQSVGGGIHDLLSKLDKQKEEDKQRARLFKSLQETADVLGIVPKDKSTVMDLDTLQGVVQGHTLKQAMADRQMAQQMHAAQLANYQAQADQRQQRGVTAQQLQSFAGDLGQQMQPTTPSNAELDQNASDFTQDPLNTMAPVPTPGLPLGQALPRSMSRYPGAVNSPEFDNLVKSLQAMHANGVNWEDVAPREKKTTSGRNVLYGKSGQFQFEPPDLGAGITQVPVLDPETGEPTGQYGLPNGRNGITYPKPAAAPKLPDSFHKTMDEITADITGAQAILDDPAAKTEQKARAKRLLSVGQQRGKAVIDRYHTGGFFDATQRDSHYSELGLPPIGGTSSTSPKSKTVTPDVAKQFLQQAGGDKDKARALARAAGYAF